ncbi:MAG: hypothetical protein B1H04_03180 [Planctomycetales bacterium 4484_123]|nr:MAG: hypothetical protein B1H04_03180 [Planctomycetales bacterium 4484_123]
MPLGPALMAKVRIQKVLAAAGLASRRAVEEMVRAGRISVNGRVVTELPCFVGPGDQVLVDGQKVRKRPERNVYYLLNKPRGVICTSKDEPGRNRPRAVDLIPPMGRRVYCVGRLDADSTGLIILTNDGELTHRLTHPSFGVVKTYRARVDGRVTPQELAALRRGVHVGGRRTRGATVKCLRRGANESLLELKIAEGRNRQVRRMLARLGHKVRRRRFPSVRRVCGAGPCPLGRPWIACGGEVAASAGRPVVEGTSMQRRVCVWACGALLALLAGCDGAVSPEGRKALLAASTAYQRGDDSTAITQAGKFLAMHPRLPASAEAYYIRGLARCRTGQTAAGKADLLTAIRLARRADLKAQAHAKLGELAYVGGELAEAERHYRAVLELGRPAAPPADQALYRVACILQRRGRWSEADLLLRRLRHLFAETPLAERARQRVGARFWSVQAGAFGRRPGAQELADRLRAAGLPARVDLELRGGKLMRLVLVGAYSTYQAASRVLPEVRKLRSDAFLVPAR